MSFRGRGGGGGGGRGFGRKYTNTKQTKLFDKILSLIKKYIYN